MRKQKKEVINDVFHFFSSFGCLLFAFSFVLLATVSIVIGGEKSGKKGDWTERWNS
jgi:hypothetical protein